MKYAIILLAILLLVGCTPDNQNEIDNEIFEKAVMENNIQLCDSIKTEAFKTSCIAEVSINLGDESRCDETGKSQDYCLSSIANNTLNPELCKQVVEGYWGDICFGNIALGLEDESYCEQVFADEAYNDCYRNVAEATLNPEICGMIQIANKKMWCVIDIAVAKEDHKVCDYISYKPARYGTCYTKIARLTENPEICDEIDVDFIQQNCKKKFE